MGIFYKNNVIEKKPFMDLYAGVVLNYWQKLEPAIAIRRHVSSAAWENFELLAIEASDWVAHIGTTFPKGKRRMPLEDKWLTADDATAASSDIAPVARYGAGEKT